jgi:ADP-heptose:LPS heptosyltransferase
MRQIPWTEKHQLNVALISGGSEARAYLRSFRLPFDQGNSVQGSAPKRQVFGREVAPIEKFKRTVSTLQTFRRSVAPPGSFREKVVRLFYAPFLMALPTNPFDPDLPPQTMEAEIVTLRDVATGEGSPYPIRRIVILKLDHIGDMIIGMRAMQQLRDGFPTAYITLVCGSWNAALAEHSRLFDKVISFDLFPALHRDWSGPETLVTSFYDTIHDLCLDDADLAIDLRHDADTRPCLYRIPARFRAGFYAPSEPQQPFLDLMLPVSEALHVSDGTSHSLHAELRLQLLATACVATFGLKSPHPLRSLAPPANPMHERKFAVLAIGAGDPIRVWPIERYAEVARRLHSEHDFEIVVLGGTAEQEDADRLKVLLSPLPARAAIGMSLVELQRLVAAAALCVCNGSGIAHLAAALDVPTVCVLGGASRMDVWRPSSARAISLGGMTACQPCGLQYSADCPWQVACLSVIQPDHVIEACRKLLLVAQ